MKPNRITFENIRTYSLKERPSKVGIDDLAGIIKKGLTVRDFLSILPNQLAAREFRELVERIVQAKRENRLVLMGMGAHVIKVGLNPIIITLIEQGIIDGIATNGACIVHDTELAMEGKTSEDVAEQLRDGQFGMAKETGEFLNQAINHAYEKDMGLGESVGEALLHSNFPYKDYSLYAQAFKLRVPITVHVAIGTDIIHIHPSAKGEAIGRASFHDFQLFCALVARLDGGVFLHFGSAVIIPEVFLKALTVVRNLGYTVKNITTANFDFIRHYRPQMNVVMRPTQDGGRGFNFTGHHEIMIPLLACAIMEELG